MNLGYLAISPRRSCSSVWRDNNARRHQRITSTLFRTRNLSALSSTATEIVPVQGSSLNLGYCGIALRCKSSSHPLAGVGFSSQHRHRKPLITSNLEGHRRFAYETPQRGDWGVQEWTNCLVARLDQTLVTWPWSGELVKDETRGPRDAPAVWNRDNRQTKASDINGHGL